MPLTFILESSLDSHAQDIQENIFEYQFSAANDDPEKQSLLVEKRGNELKETASKKKAFIQALLELDGAISDEQLAGMAELLDTSFEKLDKWSKKLEEKAAGLGILNGHKGYSDLLPLKGDINSGKDLADRLKEKDVPPGQEKK